MIVKELLQEKLEGLLNKTVYFMHDNKIMKGKIVSYDNFQLYIGKKYGISYYRPFFFSESEIIEYLTKNIEVIKIEEFINEKI